MNTHPPEPIQYGWTTDNIGNVLGFIVPHVLDDMVSDIEQGDPSLALAVLKEIQCEIKKLPSLYQPYAEADSNPGSVIEEVA